MGGGVCVTVTISTKMRPIHVHVRYVFSLFMKFGGPPKGREGRGGVHPCNISLVLNRAKVDYHPKIRTFIT